MARFINVGILCKKKDNSGFYIKFDKDFDYKELDGVSYINVNSPKDKYDRMLQSDKITEEEHEAKVSRYNKGGDLEWIRQELLVVKDS